MIDQDIFCPGGCDSQTGAAVKIRFSEASIKNCGKIPDVLQQLDKNPGPYVIPIWNSHEGEVRTAGYVWDLIEEAKIKISDIWAKKIEFWFVRKVGDAPIHKKIGSVLVARTQCSIFIKNQNAELIGKELTTIAFEDYRQGEAWDGVLVAEGLGENETGYEIVTKKTANPNNFTSFVRFMRSDTFVIDEALTNSWLTGVTMRSLGDSLGEAEQSFFTQMLNTVTNLNDIPKLVFVLKRTAKVGLLFEGMRLFAGDLLDAEELESSSISVYEDAGMVARQYTDELRNLFEQNFPDLNRGDFILHQGINTCLFACPPLGLYTHGYEVDSVEPVIRFYISELFGLWDAGVSCGSDQQKFFERYNDIWKEQGTQFIKFIEIGIITT